MSVLALVVAVLFAVVFIRMSFLLSAQRKAGH
jgi:hypothetical protein